MPMKLILKVIGTGLLISIIFFLPFVLGIETENSVVGYLFHAWIQLVTLLSFPITALFCKGICVGEESLSIILAAPITGFIIGIIIGWLINRKKYRGITN